jgi:hypothetical protein
VVLGSPSGEAKVSARPFRLPIRTRICSDGPAVRLSGAERRGRNKHSLRVRIPETSLRFVVAASVLIKVLWWDGKGCVCQKHLEHGRINLP